MKKKRWFCPEHGYGKCDCPYAGYKDENKCPYGCIDGIIYGEPRWYMDTNKQVCPLCGFMDEDRELYLKEKDDD